MYGIQIPSNVLEALDLDKNCKQGGLWRKAIQKEVAMLIKYKVFTALEDHKRCCKENGWQYAPILWVFTVKHDLRRKARMVIGGHVTDSEELD